MHEVTRRRPEENMLARTLLSSGALLAALVVTWQIIRPLQAEYATILPSMAPLMIYLPFGIKALCAYFDGFWSMVFLMPGALLANQVFFHNPWELPSTWLAILASYASAPFVFLLMDWATLADRRRHSLHPRAWRVVLFGGAVSSLLGASLVHVIKSGRIPEGQALRSLATYALGDLLGLIATMFILMWIFRLQRLTGRRRK